MIMGRKNQKKLIKHSLIFIFLGLFSCERVNDKKIENGKNSDTVLQDSTLENWDSFYDKFHKDTAFQMERIQFPLPGFDVDADNVIDSDEKNRNFYWKKKDWIFMHLPTLDSTYNVDKKISIYEYEENISIPNSGFYTIRKFKISNKKWYLIYYGNQSL
jgi:hypothetical protein